MFTVKFNNSSTRHSTKAAALGYARKWTRFYASRMVGGCSMFIFDFEGRIVCQVNNGYKVVVPCRNCGVNRVHVLGASCNACCNAPS